MAAIQGLGQRSISRKAVVQLEQPVAHVVLGPALTLL